MSYSNQNKDDAPGILKGLLYVYLGIGVVANIVFLGPSAVAAAATAFGVVMSFLAAKASVMSIGTAIAVLQKLIETNGDTEKAIKAGLARGGSEVAIRAFVELLKSIKDGFVKNL